MRLLLTFIIFILGGFYTFGDNNCCEQCCEYLEDCCNKEEGEVENGSNENAKENESNENNENNENIPIDVGDNANNNKDYHNVSLKIEKFSDITTDGITLSGSNLDDMDGEYVHWGIIGEKGVGKTFLFKKICGIESDISNVEQGVLTFRFNKEIHLMFIENNVSHPISYFKEEEKENINKFINQEDMKVDCLLKYKFVKEFIKGYSEQMIIVCDEIKNDEDVSYLNNLIKDYSAPFKRQIVVHNVRNYNTVESLNEYIKQICEKLSLKKKGMISTKQSDLNFACYEQQKVGEDRDNILHVFIANDVSDEIKDNNKNAVLFLKFFLNEKSSSNKVILEQIKNSFITISDEICEKKMNNGNFSIEKDEDNTCIKYNEDLLYREYFKKDIIGEILTKDYYDESIINYNKTVHEDYFLCFYFTLAEGITFKTTSFFFIFNERKECFLYLNVSYLKENSIHEEKIDVYHKLSSEDWEIVDIHNEDGKKFRNGNGQLIYCIPIKKKIKKVYE